ncbi:GDP-L-galactose phosphorylase 1-like [Phalaenopsis equestris]|uniref:GDP-L-galactose phosphorylase 1-like n=1 Tax=Phalaenopsis equestris TaxID=78828 RepID=UPI0009E1D749|nr:GDP-L-galactose phosphorylase 1-like [Phalaenopsis equestris]
MVSFVRFEGEYPFVKQNTSQEQSKRYDAPLRDGGFSCTADDGLSLLDTLILSQWEERAWMGQLSYDVTSCETKIVGRRKLIAQLNEEWNSNFSKEFEKKAFQPSGGNVKPSFLKNNREEILFCVASGERERSMFVPLIAAPQDGILVIVNPNPIEYGHIFLVPYHLHQRTQAISGALLSISQIADEVNNFSFRIFFDYFSATNMDRTYFQAIYSANPLPVELLPIIPIYGSSHIDGIQILEVADYPLNALVFVSKNLKKLAHAVGEICSTLQRRSTVFNLLISDCGTKMFLFPQVHLLVTGRHLHAWECGGYFLYSKSSDFDDASEPEISERLASVSMDAEGFQSLKQLCCGLTAMVS